ncbi:ribosome maturation factor RimM [Magnetococcales bacterium HHB-1]
MGDDAFNEVSVLDDPRPLQWSEDCRDLEESPELLVGKIMGSFGVRGEMRVQALTELPENILSFPWWWLGSENQVLKKHQLIKGRRHGPGVVVQLSEVTDLDQAKALFGVEVWVPRSYLPEIEEDHYYYGDLIGCQVISDKEEKIGVVASIFPTGANDVLVVEDLNGEERLLPMIDDVMLEVDLEQRILQVHLLPGM